MATYTATGSHNDANLSQSDKNKIQAYKDAYASATTEAARNAAHAGAEAIRANSGYSGGLDGSEYNVYDSQKYNKPSLMGADQLNSLYGLNINENDIYSKFNAASRDEYALKNKQYLNTENKFYDRLFDTQVSSLDAIKKANAAAVATGASRGAQAANELSSILGLQQISVDDSTLLAQDRNLLAAEEAAAYTKNRRDSMQYADGNRNSLAGLAGNIYGYDTQLAASRVGADAQLDYNAKYLEAAMLNAEANKYVQSSYSRSSGGGSGTSATSPQVTGTIGEQLYGLAEKAILATDARTKQQAMDDLIVAASMAGFRDPEAKARELMEGATGQYKEVGQAKYNSGITSPYGSTEASMTDNFNAKLTPIGQQSNATVWFQKTSVDPKTQKTTTIYQNAATGDVRTTKPTSGTITVIPGTTK